MAIKNIKGSFTLSNGAKMPYLGLGVYQSEQVKKAIAWAFEFGYRHIDTASIYGNEKEVGEAIKESGIKRKDIFVVSKVWNDDQGYDSTINAFYKSLKKLQLEYLDLYLIHWPVEKKYVATWKALEYLYKKGLIQSIGVSNFKRPHLEELLSQTEIIPMVNQMEFHPYLVQQELINFCQSKGIQYEAWSPLMRGKIMNIDPLKKLAIKYEKTIAQIVLRWNLQKGIVTIPKSSNKNRIAENANLFDFELSPEDIDVINQLDKNHRIGPDPDNFSF